MTRLKRCVLCKTTLPAGFTGRYCRSCRPEQGNDFTKNVLRLQGTIEYIADQRGRGVPWRIIAEALKYPGRPERFAAYVTGTSEWLDFMHRTRGHVTAD